MRIASAFHKTVALSATAFNSPMAVARSTVVVIFPVMCRSNGTFVVVVIAAITATATMTAIAAVTMTALRKTAGCKN